jgi:hypothetical protein
VLKVFGDELRDVQRTRGQTVHVQDLGDGQQSDADEVQVILWFVCVGDFRNCLYVGVDTQTHYNHFGYRTDY